MQNSMTELHNQMASLMLMNEDILIKLETSSKLEVEHTKLIKNLREEKDTKSKNDEILNTVKGLKTNMDDLIAKYDSIEERMRALETQRSSIKKVDIVKIEKQKVIIQYLIKRQYNIDC